MDQTATGEPNNNSSTMEGIVGVPVEDKKQYENNYNAHKAGISHDEMVQVYTQWAGNYDKDLCPGRYNGPEIAARAMSSFYKDDDIRPTLKILDVAAGTGRVGVELDKFGFKLFDALEPSPGMLEVLRKRGLYALTYETAIGHGIIAEIETNFYDALVIAGGMGEGHIPVKAVDEMIRIVKPGGMIFVIMREEYLSYVPEYTGKLEPYMESLVDEGLWAKVQREVVANYSFNKNGVVFIYQKI
ncbi:Williams-Beuren syndrome chromosomal region 27 protein [Orchesella cincta]|uniref:Williams-Beuren syndrome chromosomal region 27 protein n=1 Tax=Orchesella cincta TaxID=48709 RepID=A0A1D2N1B7_ORCCI|nr:Williams-Beuren syndrome chromosomal region 27 protein [Orchesella cincta]